jgi:acetyl-CoA synthetase
VADVGVVGIPDPVAGNRIKAFVVAAPGHEPDDALRRELLGFARSQLGAAVAPKSIEFRDALPKTDSGKTIRRLLRDEAIAAEAQAGGAS